LDWIIATGDAGLPRSSRVKSADAIASWTGGSRGLNIEACGGGFSLLPRSERKMADTDLYETDILAWSEQQADALRELAARRDLPNALDLTHVVEEIADVGQSELNAVKSFIRLVLGHAIKCVADPDSPSLRHWQAEVGNWQNELADRVAPSMRRRIDLNILWGRAVRQAELDLLGQERDANAVMAVVAACGTHCPISLDELLADPAQPAALVARIGQALRA
jgi:hypothetical protein